MSKMAFETKEMKYSINCVGKTGWSSKNKKKNQSLHFFTMRIDYIQKKIEDI